MASTELRLLEKIRPLPPKQLSTVEAFIDALHSSSDRALVLAVSQLSKPALQRIWDNADDAEYDQL